MRSSVGHSSHSILTRIIVLVVWMSISCQFYLLPCCCHAWSSTLALIGRTPSFKSPSEGTNVPSRHPKRRRQQQQQYQTGGGNFVKLHLLSSDIYLENDLVAVQYSRTDMDPKDGNHDNSDEDDEKDVSSRLCVVREDGSVSPLCQHADDAETDLYIDPRITGTEEPPRDSNGNWDVSDNDIQGTYGEGWYGQRPVPSLGGGPGYGADADDIWSIDESLLELLEQDNVDVPLLDIGIAHGEKARGGAY
mmetsp:Transcript_5519/g.8420  ORF Transcript_5519/g.8420 Transcript_5519/m.8420 type:complete len:248 (-) Transcript_5519:383-1126(-)|eukprot:CAMPEP_0195298192 /NCGR_PEP_ID=MMETSP0707-20130614/22957_1 /TAXON_ID=33640 /ORGANISM="Asterionellopsis glacialis, Strain CCMP134" /LENGTH=247 /DNA_ID=CAMNT_0040360211 /DNA_START=124 /DNA_END=867 /DNA_ORIENTATION=-